MISPTRTLPRRALHRRGPIAALVGLGIAGALLFLVVCYVLSVLWWGWILMLATGAGGLDWSYSYTITHWALLCPFVLG